MKKDKMFQYGYIVVREGGWSELVTELNELGKRGWEAFHMIPHRDTEEEFGWFEVFIKREM